MRRDGGGEDRLAGGITGYPLERIYEEVAYIADAFHWSSAEILAMPHWERIRWCETIGARRGVRETEARNE
jgi:hypothetical protein